MRSRCTDAAATLSLAALLFARAVEARVYSPRILSEHVADTSSLEAFRAFPAWKDKTGQELALAVWQYLVGTETGVFHYQPIREGADPVSYEFRIVYDPITMLNVYGYGFCGAFGPTTAGIFEGIGFEQARAVGIPGAAHSVTEVWYGNAWHYFDVDLRGVIFRRDGATVASIQDLIDEPDLWTKPSRRIDPFFPKDHDLSTYARSYRARPVDYYYRWFTGAATMDFALRRGESLTRSFRPQGGRWSHQKEDAPDDFWRRLIAQEPYGAKGNHPEFSIWTHGNGVFDYRPNLRAGSRDFADGVFAADNIVQGPEGLTLERAGEGDVVFEVLSPYVIVPLVGDLDDRSDDREASVVEFTARGGAVRLSISTDFGRSFAPVAAALGPQGDATIDLTPHLRERYQYLLKFTVLGRPGEVWLETLRIRTHVQVAPISLPRLRKGLNRLEYRTRDKRGLAALPWHEVPNMGSREEMARYWAAEPKDFDPARFTARLRGEAVVRFPAPPGRKIAWASLGGAFATHQRDRAPATANELSYAADDSREWIPVHRARVPAWHSHWHYAFDEEVVLPRPAGELRVRYLGDPGVNRIRVNLHSIAPGVEAEERVAVTHTYRMAGEMIERRFSFDRPRSYSIECPEVPEDISIRIEVAGD